MGRRIVGIIFVVAVIVGGYYLWQHYAAQRQMADGAVTCSGCMTPDEKARFDKENSGDTADGQSERKNESARQSAAEIASGGTGDGGTGTPVNSAPAAARNAAAPAASPGNVTNGPPIPAAGSYAISSGGAPVGGPLPTSDSQSPSAPNNLHFEGSGAYQWYRQGNITYRVDTVSGSSCIAYATMDEWRKQVVYSHGCGRGA